MQKIFTPIIYICLTLLICSACSVNSNTIASNGSNKPSADMDNTGNTDNSGNNTAITRQGLSKLLPADCNGISSIQIADNDKLIIVAMKISGSASSGAAASIGLNIGAGIEFQILLANTNPLSIENQTGYLSGYDAIGNPAVFPDKVLVAARNASSGKVDVLIFDNGLAFVKAVSFGASIINPEAVSFSEGGYKAIAANDNAQRIISLDINTGAENVIFDVSGTGLIGISNAKLCDGGAKLAFNGHIERQTNAIPVYGLITLADKSVKIYENIHIDREIQITSKFAFWDEVSFEYGVASNGVIYMVDYQASSLKTFTLKEKNESQQAYISGNGKTIVTVMNNHTSGTSTVRVYDVAENAAIKEFSINSLSISVIVYPDGSKFAAYFFDSDGVCLLEYRI